MDFSADLGFAIPDEKTWDYFRSPDRYQELCASHPAAAEDLKRLLFITQRAPNEFASDRSPTGLTTYLDEIAGVLKRNAGILKLAESMQVIYRPGAPVDFAKRIATALSGVALT
jgi:ligand-binding SRPBCC domain-containing protein